MSKHFFMQYYPGEWLSDARVSQCRPATRGIWWDAISAMHGIDRCGQLSGTVEALARAWSAKIRNSLGILWSHSVLAKSFSPFQAFMEFDIYPFFSESP
jgi:hypothetical protein